MLQYSSIFVRKLTALRMRRREFDVYRLLLGAFLMFAGINASATAAQWQATEDITAVAEAYIRGMVGSDTQHTSVHAANLDSRHRLARCSKPLEAFLRRGTEQKARTIVGVRCNGARPWKIYVPVDVTVTRNVWIAKRSLPRGHVLTAEDLTQAERDVTRLLSGYVTDQTQLLGQRLKTQLIAGKILTPGLLQVDIAIRRGQTVTLTAGGGEFSIAMTGTALMDGALNQRIRVENTHSGRVVEGIVRSREHVEVLTSRTSHFFDAGPKVSAQVADTSSSNNDR